MGPCTNLLDVASLIVLACSPSLLITGCLCTCPSVLLSSTRKYVHNLNLATQAIEKLKLDTETPAAGVRPKGLGMVSCVGTEYVSFKSPLPLDNKVITSTLARHSY